MSELTMRKADFFFFTQTNRAAQTSGQFSGQKLQNPNHPAACCLGTRCCDRCRLLGCSHPTCRARQQVQPVTRKVPKRKVPLPLLFVLVLLTFHTTTSMLLLSNLKQRFTWLFLQQLEVQLRSTVFPQFKNFFMQFTLLVIWKK